MTSIFKNVNKIQNNISVYCFDFMGFFLQFFVILIAIYLPFSVLFLLYSVYSLCLFTTTTLLVIEHTQREKYLSYFNVDNRHFSTDWMFCRQTADLIITFSQIYRFCVKKIKLEIFYLKNFEIPKKFKNFFLTHCYNGRYF